MTAFSLMQRQRLSLSPSGRRLTAPAGPIAISPPTLSFWYDAALSDWDGSTLTDLSGNGNHATVPSGAPTLTIDAAGRDVLRFDGVDDHIKVTTPPNHTSGDGVTFWVAGRLRAYTAFEGIMSAAATGATDHESFWALQQGASLGDLRLYAKSLEITPTDLVNVDDGGMFLAICTFKESTGAVEYRDHDSAPGASSTIKAMGTPDLLFIGARIATGAAGSYGAIDLYSAGMYEGLLSNDQRDVLQAYLEARYLFDDGLMAERDFTAGASAGPDWIFSRASGGMARDHAGLWSADVKSGELRYDGLRRVRNWFPNSDSPATQTIVGSPRSTRMAIYFRSGGGSGVATLSGGASGAVAEGQALIFTTATVTDLTVTISGAPGAGSTIQVEVMPDAASPDAPGDYVSSTTVYNAAVAGVRYFTTTNGNSFTGPGPGAVTEAAGTAIAVATRKGVLLEPQATNVIDRSYDFTAWGQTSITVTNNQNGIGGQAARASTVTDASAAAEGKISLGYSLVGSGVNVVAQWWLKKDSEATEIRACLLVNAFTDSAGSLGVLVRTSDGAVVSWTDGPAIDDYAVESVGDWWRVRVSSVNGKTGNMRYYPSWTSVLAPNQAKDVTRQGSGVIGHAQVEEGVLLPSSPIQTNGATATRLADILTLPAPGVAPGAIGIEMGFELPHDPSSIAAANLRLFGSGDATGVTEEIRTKGGAGWAWTPETGNKGGKLEILASDLMANTAHTLGLSLTDAEQVAVLDAVTELDDSQSLSLDHSDTEIQLGSWDGSGAVEMPGMTLASFSYWMRNVVRSRVEP